MWRTHFYAGLLSTPFIVTMAITGLIILYGQPQDLTQGHLRQVTPAGAALTYIAVLYPRRGASAVLLLGFDRFIIRRTGRLRRLFGQPARVVAG